MKTYRVSFSLIAMTVAVACLLSPAMAHAGLIITLEPSVPSPIATGSTAYVDVLVRSDNNDTLSQFLVDFEITPAGDLNLVDQLADPSVNDYVTDPNYVFASVGENPTPYSANTAAFTATILDFLSTGFVQLSSTDLLLARLPLMASATATTGSYTLSLDDAVSQLFINKDGDVLSYSSDPLVVQVVSDTSAVPEPSSFVLLLCAAAGCGLLPRREVKRKRSSCVTCAGV